MRQLVESDPQVQITWRAFELRPEPVPQIDPQGEYLQRVWNNSVYPLAAQLGVAMQMPPVKPRSRLAHEAAYWARAQGRFLDYHSEIFRAYFERGEDIGNVEVLLALAVHRGLDGRSLQESLETHQFLNDVLADERDAATININGVPAFLANRKAALSGVQPVENLKRLVERVRVSG